MRATGIVRRIDDLGRVVIPKEIRKSIGINEGDPLEIFTIKEDGKTMVVFSPYVEETKTQVEVEKLESLLRAMEILKRDIFDTTPNDVSDEIENIMDEVRQLFPNEE